MFIQDLSQYHTDPILPPYGRCSLISVKTIQKSTFPVLNLHQSTQSSSVKPISKLFNSTTLYHSIISRFLILRHRDYNGDISQVSKIDLHGRSNDAAEAPKLGSFSFLIENFSIFHKMLFLELLFLTCRAF